MVTSHDSDVDAPALAAAIAARPAYIGAMGSRGRQAQRREWLLAQGVTEERARPRCTARPGSTSARTRRPRSPCRSSPSWSRTLRGATVEGSLKDGSGPIHPDLPPGETFTPDG